MRFILILKIIIYAFKMFSVIVCFKRLFLRRPSIFKSWVGDIGLEIKKKSNKILTNFVQILRDNNCNVLRPDIVPGWESSTKTPWWETDYQYGTPCPRDLFIKFVNELFFKGDKFILILFLLIKKIYREYLIFLKKLFIFL